jgi:hypothetical protein
MTTLSRLVYATATTVMKAVALIPIVIALAVVLATWTRLTAAKAAAMVAPMVLVVALTNPKGVD